MLSVLENSRRKVEIREDRSVNHTEKFEEILTVILDELKSTSQVDIPIGVSNRHIHLSQKDAEELFGLGFSLTKLKDLSQPGQYACKETVIICGPKGIIEKVRILGPIRPRTQVEILASDCYKLGINAPIKSSGELDGTPGGYTLVGPKGSVQLKSGLIVAQRHIHMTGDDSKRLQVCDGQIVSIEVPGKRGGVLHNTIIRANDASYLECHLDMEEANALGVDAFSTATIIK
jgi:propanediol utilization protein